jgi:competence protein ComEC
MRSQLLLVVAFVSILAGGARAANTLDVYFIDTEGGQATLLVAPSGETMLIDTGNAALNTQNPARPVVRDAERIVAVATLAGVTRIDALVTTHFHGDHMGGLTAVVGQLPVRNFVDHGPAVQDSEPLKQKAGEYSELYAALFAGAKHQPVAPGDKIAVSGLDVTVVAAATKTIARTGTPNSYCAGIEPRAENVASEDPQSVGIVVAYGKFQFSNFGDLTWNRELALLCPDNKLGFIDVYETPRHGGEPSPAVYAVAPRIIVMDDGPRKGNPAESQMAWRKSPGLEDIWQLHVNTQTGRDGNAPEAYSANLDDTDNANHAAHYLKVSASDDGSFTMYNSRTNATKRYAKKR